MSVIVFQNEAKITASGKTGILKPDANGYYEVVLGAFGIDNTSGIYWDDSRVKNLFTNSSDLKERINNGQLYGEWGHPKLTPGMTERDYLIKLLIMHEEQYSHHIKKVELHENFKGHNNQNCLGTIGFVKPFGPRGNLLEASFANSDMNTAFSLRSLAATRTNSVGKRIKDPIKIITWDAVGEGGIPCADKYHNPALESRSFDYDSEYVEFTKTDVVSAFNSQEIQLAGNESAKSDLVGLAESIGISDINHMLGTNLNMDDVKERVYKNNWLRW